MIFHIKGHIVRKTWGFNQHKPKPKHQSIVPTTETIQGTLCYMSAMSDEEARKKVKEQYPDFNIETVELVTEEQVILMLSKQNHLYHAA